LKGLLRGWSGKRAFEPDSGNHLPIASGGNFARTAGFAVSLTGAGTKTTGVVRCDQPRALDLGARHGRKLENVPAAIMDEVLAKVATILE
jgi:mRNA interferase ChpB